MADMVFYPSKIKGNVKIPGSKSETHRYLLAAALSEEKTVIQNPLICDDTRKTAECIGKMGGKVIFKEGIAIVEPLEKEGRCAVLECGESASTARFFLPTAGILREKTYITCGNMLEKRPFNDIFGCLRENGVCILDSGGHLPCVTFGKPRGGKYVIKNNISSQYASGLMFALPMASEDSTIEFDSVPESEIYVKLTEEILNEFSVKAQYLDGKITISGRQKYITPGNVTVGNDPSFENVWYGIGRMCGQYAKTAGDDNKRNNRPESEAKKYIDLILDSNESKIAINAADCIDSVPILAVISCATEKNVEISGIKRLKYKECDRKKGIISLIQSLGGEIYLSDEDRIVINGKGFLQGGCVESFRDHRMVMAAAAASVISKEPVTVRDYESVSKSYPEFVKDFISLGGKTDVINVR